MLCSNSFPQDFRSLRLRLASAGSSALRHFSRRAEFDGPILEAAETTEVGRNQYSGHFGLGSFPLHTDLTHWRLPPRYLLLRCLTGSENVFTSLLASSYVAGAVGMHTLQRAILRTRRHHEGCSGLFVQCPFTARKKFSVGIRYFFSSNKYARSLKHMMLILSCEERALRVRLGNSLRSFQTRAPWATRPR